MPDTSYTLPVWRDTRIRHYHRTQSGKVVEFVVQLEVEVRGTWQPAVRYDTAHGFAHIDRYNINGRSKKEKLALNFGQALTRAEREVKENWAAYRARFLKGEWP